MGRIRFGFSELAWSIFVRDRAHCQYCGASGHGDFALWRQLEIDQLVPGSAGGEDEGYSLVLCCRHCRELLDGWEAAEDVGSDPLAASRRGGPRVDELSAYAAMMRAIEEAEWRGRGGPLPEHGGERKLLGSGCGRWSPPAPRARSPRARA